MTGHETVLYAFGLTLLAGLSTGIGSTLAFFTKRTNTNFLSIALGFSAGVMIYVSFVEIFPQATNALSQQFPLTAEWITTLSFFAGILIIAIIDKLVPSLENPHEVKMVEEMEDIDKCRKLKRLGVFTAMAITIHNFPEGIATFITALNDPGLGLAIAIAIAIHNIPEGIAVSVPIYYSTKSKKKAFWYSFLSGAAEPLGAFIAYLFLMPFLQNSGIIMGVALSSVAGIMVFISLDELLPTAKEYGKHHLSIYGLVAGMGVMALSLLLL